MFDKPKSKVALAAIKELSDKIEAADGASLQCKYDYSVPVALLNVLEWLAYTSRAFKFTFFQYYLLYAIIEMIGKCIKKHLCL